MSRPVLMHVTTVPISLVFLRGQAAHMQRAGYDVHVVSSPGPELDRFAETEGVTVHGVDMPRRISPGQDLVAVWRLVRLMRRVRPTIVHAHTPKGGLLGMIAARLAGAPVRIYHMRGLPSLTATGARRALLEATERVSCAVAHRALCVSHSLRDAAIERRLARPERIVVPAGGSGNGVDASGRFNPDRFDAKGRADARVRFDVPQDAEVLLFVGRVARDKGIEELALAWDRVARRSARAHLLVCGSPDERDVVPAEVLGRLRGDARVRMLETIEDVPSAYAVADLVVLPTYREGFPNVLLEAAAMGVPCVATRVHGCIDAVEEGVTGALVPARDAAALASAIEGYLADAARRRAHGAAARARVLRDFRQEVVWDAFLAEYRSLLPASKA